MNKFIKTQNSESNSLVRFISHIYQNVDVKFNLFMMSEPKYIVILKGIFCSIVAGGTSHLYSIFP